MTWARRLCSVVLAVNLLASGGILYLRERDRAAPVSVDAAIERFRTAGTVPPATATEPATATTISLGESPPQTSASTPMTAPEAASVDAAATSRQLAEGVYVYDTTGFEETDAFGGAHHDYPARTTITVRSAGCGLIVRWDVLEHRSDATELCRGARATTFIASFESRHEFFGRTDQRTLTCEPGSVYQPAPDTPVGTTWTFRCASASTTQATTATLVGREHIEVSGTSVEVVHIQQRSSAGGDSGGTIVRDLWLREGDGLLVRDRSEVDSSTQAGAIHARYREQYELRLTSLTPRR